MHQQLCRQVVKSFSGRKVTFCICVLAIATSACTPTPEISSTPPGNITQLPASKNTQKGDELATVTMAIILWQVSAEQEKKLQPLADYLTKALKRPFKFQITKDYTTAVDALVKGKVDLAYLGPSSYIEARLQDPKIEPLVSPINQETKRPWYTSVIIAQYGSVKPRKLISDVKFRSFNSLSSTSVLRFLRAKL